MPSAQAEEPVYCTSSDSIRLFHQQDVDAFQANYGPCDTVQHSIAIGDNNRSNASDRINNLDGLAGIKEIQGHLDIYYNRKLTDFSGISGLEKVDGNVVFDRNGVDYSDNQSYQINLPNLIALGGGIYIRYGNSTNNSKLTGFSADNLAEISDLFVDDYNSLTSLSLSKLKKVSNDVFLDRSGLVDLSGLSSLEEIGGSLTISELTQLSSVEGLSNLSLVGGSITISGNSAITELYGLQYMEVVGGDLQVRENALLSDCVGLASILGWPFGFSNVVGDTIIENNAGGCNSVQEILDLAADTDGDGYFDTQDAFLKTAAAFDNDHDGQPDNWLEGQSASTSSTGLTLDDDDDNDGVPDSLDAFPFDASESLDLDGDGIGDNSDPDIDGDGVVNAQDAYPYASTANLGDYDKDGRPDDCDFTATTDFQPTPTNAICVAPELDTYFAQNESRMLDDLDADNDGVPDQIDIAPLDPGLPEGGASKLFFEPIGDSVAGAGRNQFFGRYLDMDEDGKTIAIGGISTVSVLRKRGEGWEQLGNSLGADFGAAQYRRVQLGRNGVNVAISSENYGESVDAGGAGEKSGRVQIYRWNALSWESMGNPINGSSANALFGSSLAMNKYGLRVAIGAPGEEDPDSNFPVGSVAIFQWSEESGWGPNAEREGPFSKIWGTLANGGFGASVAMSRDAGIIAVGAPGQEDGSVSESSVHVFQGTDAGYVPMGAPIQGKVAKEFFGRSVALDQLGTTLAVGADGADVNGENSGVVRAYSGMAPPGRKWELISKERPLVMPVAPPLT